MLRALGTEPRLRIVRLLLAETQKLKPKQGAHRAFADDPNQLLDRIGFRIWRTLDWSDLILSKREVGLRRHSGRSVETDALARLACDRQGDAAPVLRDCVGARLMLPSAGFRIGPVADIADQRLGLRF